MHSHAGSKWQVWTSATSGTADIDGDQRLREQFEITAQNDKPAADVANARAVVPSMTAPIVAALISAELRRFSLKR